MGGKTSWSSHVVRRQKNVELTLGGEGAFGSVIMGERGGKQEEKKQSSQVSGRVHKMRPNSLSCQVSDRVTWLEGRKTSS